MKKHPVKSADTVDVSSARPEIDSSPKAYTVRQQIVSGLKLAAIGGILFLALWLFEKL